MNLAKTVALLAVAGTAGALISNIVTPKVMTLTKLPADKTTAVSTGITAGGTALVYVLIASAL